MAARWTPFDAAETVLTGADLNGLPSGTAAANYRKSASFDNSTTRRLYADFQLVLRDGTPADTVQTAGAGAPFFDIYILPSIDGGTRYPTTNAGTSAGPTSLVYRAASIVVPAAVAVGIISARGIILPPGHFQIMVNNQLGFTFLANNNHLFQMRRYGEEDT